MFPVAPKRDADLDILAVTGMDTLELVSRLQRSGLDQATLDGLRIMADRLCSEYPFMPGDHSWSKAGRGSAGSSHFKASGSPCPSIGKC
jgi:hypothetical protein